MRTPTMLVVGMAMIMGCTTASAQDVPGPRDYHITTTLAAGGQSEVTIVSSSTRPAYAAIAQKVQSRIRELSGADVPIVDAADVTTDDLLARHSAIVLGNLATSRFVEDLYWQWYTITDLWYPGPGGYELRTLHDPYGTGRNVVFLGGSDDEGVAAAADAFCAGLTKGEPLQVGRLMEIKLGSAPAHLQPVLQPSDHPRLPGGLLGCQPGGPALLLQRGRGGTGPLPGGRAEQRVSERWVPLLLPHACAHLGPDRGEPAVFG